MTIYRPYIIKQGDTLPILSNVFLGTWDINALATLNNLRYPYISDEPKDQLAHAKGSLQVVSYPANGNTMVISNINNLSILPLDTLYLEDWAIAKGEVLFIQNVAQSGSNLSLTFTSNMQNVYTNSVMATLFVNQENVTTKVLKTGDTLYIPDNPDVVMLNDQVSDGLGTDLKVDDAGHIMNITGSWETVSGVDNVIQAVKMRLRTEYGALLLHPTYGNRMFELEGEQSEPYYWSLVQTFCYQCIMQDPRVDEITDLAVDGEIDVNGKLIINVNANIVIGTNPPQSFLLSTKIGGNT